MTGESKVKWIGLVEVVIRCGGRLFKGNEDRKGAFVNVIALARDRDEFLRTVTSALGELGFDAVAFEDVERYAERIRHFEVDPEIRKIAAEVDSTKPVGLGTFHAFPAEPN